MRKTLVACAAAWATLASAQGDWETTLQPRDINGDRIVDAWYDTTQDITWLADAYSMGGLRWADALQRVHDLSVHGVVGWRLPTLTDTGRPGCDFAYAGTDCGFNVDPGTSEMATLYHVHLGNLSEYDESGNIRPGDAGKDYGLVESGPFRNISWGEYWTNVSDGGEGAWTFGPGQGVQWMQWGLDAQAVWPVHPGDIGLVPEPSTAAMLLLGGVALIARRWHAGGVGRHGVV